MGGDSESAAEVADPFIGGGFKSDAIDGETGGGGEGRFHRGEMGRDFGFLGDEGCVDVDEGVMTGGELANDASQQEL